MPDTGLSAVSGTSLFLLGPTGREPAAGAVGSAGRNSSWTAGFDHAKGPHQCMHPCIGPLINNIQGRDSCDMWQREDFPGRSKGRSHLSACVHQPGSSVLMWFELAAAVPEILGSKKVRVSFDLVSREYGPQLRELTWIK